MLQIRTTKLGDGYGTKSMEIVLAEYLGFCYGVKRAIRLAREAASDKTFTLGPIIHNPQMVERLAAEGVGVVSSLSEIPDGGTVVIRSHGVGPGVYAEAVARRLTVVDATCPHVKKAQTAAHGLARDGCYVVIVGERQHPEVKSICEWAGAQAAVVESVPEAEQLAELGKLGVVAQTTFSAAKFRDIAVSLLAKSNDLHVLRTICTATEQRQSAALALAANVDLMLVIGGKNSANTSRLAELCATTTPTCHLETAEELSDEWWREHCKQGTVNKIGITAGASTPDWIIREVYEKCKKR